MSANQDLQQELRANGLEEGGRSQRGGRGRNAVLCVFISLFIESSREAAHSSILCTTMDPTIEQFLTHRKCSVNIFNKGETR